MKSPHSWFSAAIRAVWVTALLLSTVFGTRAGSFTIPGWAFDRGNVAVFTETWADNGPMVAFGGSSPIVVEYEINLPNPGKYAITFEYAAARARPVDLLVDNKPAGKVCRDATGSWNTSGGKWETPVLVDLTAGLHTFKLVRNGDFPHLMSLRFESAALPQNFKPVRPNARKMPINGVGVRDISLEPNPAALRRAIKDLMQTYGERYPGGAEFLKRVDAMESRLAHEATAESARTNLARLQREALLANPALDFDRLLVLKRGFGKKPQARTAMGGALGVGTLNAHTSDDTPRQGHWQDEIAVLSGLRGKPRLSTVYQPSDTETLIDPALHFSATRLLFAKNGAKEKNWRLWEISVDGSGLKQVTPDEGADVGHFDPCYLPDGRIIFASTAVYQGLPCEFGAQAMTCLYLFDPRNGSIRQLTFEQDSDWCPTLLGNGRVLYQRWEYTDQSHSNSRMLFHMNPDGTDQREFRGSGSWFPGSFFYARAIPGEPHQVIGIATGHHGTPRSGRLLILDPSRGRRDGEGIVQEIPGYDRAVEPIVRDRLVDGVWPQFIMPWPLNAKHHVVAAKPGPGSLWGIYLVDIFDNITLVHEEEGSALLWPMVLQRTEPPPIIPDRVNLAKKEATVFITDVYQGPGLQGVPRGQVKELRVIEYYFSRRGFGGLYGTLGLDGPWDVKRILGTVPVAEDGSAFFKVPANSPLSLQPVDDKGQALQIMRSWFVGGPGEAVSCAGCHESQDEVSINKPALASRSGPVPIEPWHGPARGFNFVREVQPVLDRHCVSCHDEKGKEPYLKGDRKLTDWSSQLAGRWTGGGSFTEAYYQLQRFVRRPGIEGDRRMFTPLDYHFSSTELGQILRKGHHGVELDSQGWERLAAWVDLNAPFYGAWGEIPQFNGDEAGAKRLSATHARAMELRRKHVPMGPHPDYEQNPPGVPYDTTLATPGPVVAHEPAPPSCEGWPFPPGLAASRQQEASVEGTLTWALDLGDGVKLELMRIPGGEFLMGSHDGHPDETPQSAVDVKPFWMAKFEVSNRQFRQFKPEHESRTEDRHGYQFGVVGYDQDQPNQPAVRVSWDEAIAFCQWLSDRLKMRVTLPTEAQWEWACRSGSDQPCYGVSCQARGKFYFCFFILQAVLSFRFGLRLCSNLARLLRQCSGVNDLA